MGGAIQYVWWGKSRLTPFMFYMLTLLQNDLKRLFGVGLLVNSGIRTYEDQKRIFLERYVTAANINGRKVYDTRVWNGVRYYRISSAGTVAVPGSSNHEIQGTRAAVDIADTGSDAGITNKNSTRGKWIRANASKYGLVASGDGFGEGWHFDMNNIFAAVPNGGPTGGNDMGTIDNTEENYQVLARMLQRAFKYDIREGGYGPDYKLGPTMWEKVAAADDSADVAKIGASVGGEIAKVNVTLAGLATPDLHIDVSQLASELRNGLAPEIAEALGQALIAGSKQ